MEISDGRHSYEESSSSLPANWQGGEPRSDQHRALDGSNPDNRMIFFAKVLRSACEEEVKTLFSQYGHVYDVNLFRAFQGAPTTKGCGLVTMGTHKDAVAAIEALDRKHVWQGMESPMVVKWMDTALQRKRREQHLAAMRQGLVPSKAMGAEAWAPTGYPVASIPTQAHMAMAPYGLIGQDLGPQGPQDIPPAGSAPDAIKLFIGNIPKACTEEQLLPFFESIGKVVELIIVRDKLTHESKGSAFVWYATRAMAERAILQFNLRHALPDPTGEQDRPLVVRKAKARAKHVHPAVGMLAGMGGMEQGLLDYSGHLQPAHQAPVALHPYYPKVTQGMMAPGLDGMAMLQGGSRQRMGMVPLVAYPGVQHVGGGQLFGMQGAPRIQEAGMHVGYVPGHGPELLDGYMQGGSSQVDHAAISIAINQQQMTTVNQHMYSVQAMSGAQLNITPGTPGLFHLVVSGKQAQVDHARSLLSTFL